MDHHVHHWRFCNVPDQKHGVFGAVTTEHWIACASYTAQVHSLGAQTQIAWSLLSQGVKKLWSPRPVLFDIVDDLAHKLKLLPQTDVTLNVNAGHRRFFADTQHDTWKESKPVLDLLVALLRT